MSITKQAENKMKKVLEHFQSELKAIRTGRANPAILDNITIEVYGTAMRLRDVANVTVPESRQLLITPFDANNAGPIGSSIEKANINLQPIVEANVIRINIPPMTEDLRKEMVKECKKICEKGKISIRNSRKECNDILKKQKSEGEITEDFLKSAEKLVQELTDKFCKEIDSISITKENEILTV